MQLLRSFAEVECVRDNPEYMEFEVLDHGWTPIWKLIVEIAKLYWDLALALPIAASVCCSSAWLNSTMELRPRSYRVLARSNAVFACFSTSAVTVTRCIAVVALSHAVRTSRTTWSCNARVCSVAAFDRSAASEA